MTWLALRVVPGPEAVERWMRWAGAEEWRSSQPRNWGLRDPTL
jgi:hypothetical protein